MKIAPLILVICIALVLAACGTMQAYEGPELPSENTALIKSNFINPFNYSVIREIDGKELGHNQINVVVMPGMHTLKINVSTFSGYVAIAHYAHYSQGSKTITINARAGHVYLAHGVIKKGFTYVWVTDKNTGHIVAGEKYIDVAKSSDKQQMETLLDTSGSDIQENDVPPLPMAEVALIEPTVAGILEIDGKNIDTLQAHNKYIAVIPGTHEVGVDISKGLIKHKTSGKIILSFYAQAGRTYDVHGKIREGKPWAWITDKENDEVVAGQPFPQERAAKAQVAERDLSTPASRLIGHWTDKLDEDFYYGVPDTKGKMLGDMIWVDPNGRTLYHKYRIVNQELTGEQITIEEHYHKGLGSKPVTLMISKDGQKMKSTKRILGMNIASEHKYVDDQVRPSTAIAILETGIISANHKWTRVAVDGMPSQPVIIAGPPSFNDETPGVVRVQRVGHDGFDMRFQEWDYMDGLHTMEQIPYLVAQVGRHEELYGSLHWETGLFTHSRAQGWSSQYFTGRSFPDVPRLFLTIQTNENTKAVTARVRNVTRIGFEVAFSGQQNQAHEYLTETVGYLAIYNPIEGGETDINGVFELYDLKQVAVDEEWKSVFGKNLKLEEMTSTEKEIDHILEKADVMRLGEALFGQIVTENRGTPAALRQKD